MTRFVDARIPVVFGGEPGADDYVLHGHASWSVAHPVGCTCCAARGPAALALDRLFLDRVRGAVPWFERVVVFGEGQPVRQAVREDGVAGARFKLVAP